MVISTKMILCPPTHLCFFTQPSVLDRDDPENEEEARWEEIANAKFVFDKLDSHKQGWIVEEHFKELMLSTSATYCVDKHRPKLRSICREGRLHRDVFLTWYIEWMFGTRISAHHVQPPPLRLGSVMYSRPSQSRFLDRDDPQNEAEARREEMANAKFAFDKLDSRGKGWLGEEQFKDLMLLTVAIYSARDHGSKLRSICRGGARLYRKSFLYWHEEWIFGKRSSSGEVSTARGCARDDVTRCPSRWRSQAAGCLSCGRTELVEEGVVTASSAGGPILGGSSSGSTCALTRRALHATTTAAAGGDLTEPSTAEMVEPGKEGERYSCVHRAIGGDLGREYMHIGQSWIEKVQARR